MVNDNIEILIVDDETDFLEQAKIFLKKEDDEFEIDTVSSPDEALEKIEEGDYDAIVSDYQMPGMHGLKFLETLREDRGNDIPFIMFTGKGREEVAMEALNLGADRYIQKGGDPRTQYGVLSRAINQEVKHHKIKKNNREMRKELTETFNTIEDPIFLLNSDHEILRTNRAAEQFFGKKEEELLGISCHQIAHDKSSPLKNCPLERSLETKKAEKMEFYSERSDGYFIAKTNPILNEEGEIKKVIHQEIDITDIKKREKELKKSKMLLDSIFNDPDIYVGILDMEGKLLRANNSSLDLMGLSQEDVKGEYFWETPWWSHSEELQEKLKSGVEKASDGEIVRFKARHYGEDDKEVEVDFSLRPVRDEEGEIERLLAQGKNVEYK